MLKIVNIHPGPEPQKPVELKKPVEPEKPVLPKEGETDEYRAKLAKYAQEHLPAYQAALKEYEEKLLPAYQAALATYEQETLPAYRTKLAAFEKIRGCCRRLGCKNQPRGGRVTGSPSKLRRAVRLFCRRDEMRRRIPKKDIANLRQNDALRVAVA